LDWDLILDYKFRERRYQGDNLLIWGMGTTLDRVCSEMNYSKRRPVYED